MYNSTMILESINQPGRLLLATLVQRQPYLVVPRAQPGDALGPDDALEGRTLRLHRAHGVPEAPRVEGPPGGQFNRIKKLPKS